MMRSGNIFGSAGTMPKNWRYILLHAVIAAVFVFLLQRFALGATVETSFIWALTFAGCAAGLAWMQTNR